MFQKYRSFIPDYEEFLEALHRPLPIVIRVNTLLTTEEKLIEALAQRGFKISPLKGFRWYYELEGVEHPGSLLEHMMGHFYSQSLGSALPAFALAPEAGDKVLDMCASPGSKTTQMAQMMKNRGLIIANDKSYSRMAPLVYNLRRMGVINTITTIYAGQNFPMKWRFSRILVDVPCSGEGNGRLAPDGTLLHLRRPMDGNLPRVQKGLLIRAFDLLDEKGVLVYSTCTYNPQENEEVVDHLLRERPARLLPIELPCPHDPGLTNWEEREYGKQLKLAWRIYPHRINTVGFFMAKISRAQ